MNDSPNQPLIEALSEALETTAFLTLLPAEEPAAAPDDAVRIAMEFNGPKSGCLEIMASRKFGATLAANIMGAEEDDEEALEKAEDALKEILNITCGSLLPNLATDPADVFDITIPQLTEIDGVEQWEELAGEDGITVIDVEGTPLALRLTHKD